MTRALSFCLIILSLTGCEPGDLIDLPTSPRRITILGFNEAGAPWVIGICLTMDLNRFTPDGLPDAKVVLYEDGNFLEELVFDTADPTSPSGFPSQPEYLKYRPSIFRTDYNNVPRPGHEYKIVVEAEGYPTATASYVQPMPVEADITFEFRERKMTFGTVSFGDGRTTIDTTFTTFFDISITFADPEGENFYNFRSVQSDKQTMAESKSWSEWYLVSNDGTSNNGWGSGAVIDDVEISGQRVTSNFTTSFTAGGNYSWRIVPEWFTFSLRTTTKEMQKYIIQMGKIVAAEYDPYAQPVRTYTNVENGLGIFTGFTPSSKQFYYKGVD